MAYELQSLERAIVLMGILEKRRGARLTDLADEASCSPTTALRTLRVLERHGLVRRSHGGLDYSLGARLTELGQVAAANIELASSLRPNLIELADRYSATVHIGLFRSDAITIIDKIDSNRGGVRYSTLGEQMSLNGSAGGKAVLASLDPEEARRLVGQTHMVKTARMTIVTPDALLADIADARENGFSLEEEEYRDGFACVACALRHDGELYSVSISGALIANVDLKMRGEVLRDTVRSSAALLPGVVVAF